MKNLFIPVKQFGKVGIAAAFGLMVSTSFAQDPEIKNAERLTDQDKKKQAVNVLQKATETYPTAPHLFYHLGQAQLLAGDQAGAKATFDKGIAANPKEPLNYAGQGHIFVLEKKVPQARASFDKALSFGKKNVATLQAIAKAELGDKALSKDAFTLLQKAKEINPNDFKTALLLGDYYLSENQGGSCASAYEDAETLNPSSGIPLYKHAMLFMRTKNIPVVEEDLQKAIKADPEFALAHKELGELYYMKKDGPKAAKHYQIYLGLTDSPEKDDRFRYAFFLFMAKDYTKANEEFKLLSTKPDVTPMTLRFYAKSLTESGNLAEAQKIFESYMSTKKDSVKAVDFSNYADLLQKQGKDSLAANAIEKSISLDVNQPILLQTLIDYYFTKKRNYAKAMEFTTKAIKVRKKPFSNDFFTLGRANYFLHKYPQADSAFGKFIELQPKIALGYIWAARSKSAQDTLLTEGLAKPFYEKVIEIDLAATDPSTVKKDLIDSYSYMGSYHLTKQEIPVAKGYFEKALALSPEGAVKERIDAALKLINTPPPQQQKPRKK